MFMITTSTSTAISISIPCVGVAACNYHLKSAHKNKEMGEKNYKEEQWTDAGRLWPLLGGCNHNK